MEILGTKRFIPKGFELGTTLSWPNRSMNSLLHLCNRHINTGKDRDRKYAVVTGIVLY